MDLTQESVLSLLVKEGGRLRKSELVGKFKAAVDSVDPAEKERNRELFKTFVNNVAVVKELDGVRYVVIKKMYRHLVNDDRTAAAESRVEDTEVPPTGGEEQHPPESHEGTGGQRSPPCEPEQDQESESSENPLETLSLIQMALQRSKYQDIKIKRMLNIEIQDQSSTRPTPTHSKPFGLPLRVAPSATKVEIQKLKVDPDDPSESAKLDSSRGKRRPPPSSPGEVSISSPQLRRALKTTRASEDHRDTRIPSVVPLEHSEHEWLVKCASGHWSQVYGLLLSDQQLAEKRDFMSGFTALHWAAKWGNSEMLVKIIDLSRQGGVDVDINAKTHGGYTPLHIAALHDQEYIMAMLVGEYGADHTVRDNCGKKAYHYLHGGISETLRQMLGQPKPKPRQDHDQDRTPTEREEMDLFPDRSKGLHSISRLFQPHMTGQRKKHKQRLAFHSLSEEPGEEREDGGGGGGGSSSSSISSSSSSSFRHRLISDAFM